MQSWFHFFQRRLLTSLTLLITFGLSLSGQLFERSGFDLLSFVFSFFGVLLLLIQYHLIGEVKHHLDKTEDDSEVTPAMASGLIFRLQLFLYAYGMIIWILFSQIAAFNFMLAAIYLWHIFKEFFIPRWMERHLLAFAFAKQLVFLPIALFAITMGQTQMIMAAFSFALLLFGACYIFEICRNLNPQSHPSSLTYVHYYGFHKLFFYLLMALLLSCFAAMALGLEWLLWPMQGFVLVSMVVLYFQSSKYYWLQNGAFMLLIASSWVVAVAKSFSWLSFG